MLMIVIIDNNDHDNIDDNFNDKFFCYCFNHQIIDNIYLKLIIVNIDNNDHDNIDDNFNDDYNDNNVVIIVIVT